MMDTGMIAPVSSAPAKTRGGERPLIRAVLFDLDGTLIDSEPVYWESDVAFLSQYGIDFTEELNASMFGWGAVDFFKRLQQLFPQSPLNDLPLAERMRRKDEAYLELGRSRIQAFPGVAAFARALVSRAVPVGLASGSSPQAIGRTLAYAGLEELFPVRVSAMDVARGKPAPDIFLEAAARLCADPSQCLVLEDSAAGVRAAKAAGMACIALPGPEFIKNANRSSPRGSAGAEGNGKRDESGYEGADLVIPGGPAAFDPARVEKIWRFA